MTHNSTPADELADRLEAIYRRCSGWPERTDDGFMALLELRNVVHDEVLATLRQSPSDAIREALEHDNDTHIRAMAEALWDYEPRNSKRRFVDAAYDTQMKYIDRASYTMKQAIRALAHDNHIKGQDNAG